MKITSVSKFMRLSAILAALILQGARLLAQTDIEIEVAGPWGYVTDPNDTTRVLLISPSIADHQFMVHSGADVESVSGSPLYYGVYKLRFGLGKCTQTSQAHIQLYNVSATAQAVSNAIGAKGGRYAISLPKPCWYETYDSARALIDSKQITSTTSETIFTTWMVLHYTISDSSQPAVLIGQDDNGNQLNRSILFQANTIDKVLALSVVLYNDFLGSEDYMCDSHSAYYFDQSARDFWGQTNLYYLFPELYGLGQQSDRYNYGKCNYSTMTGGAEMRQRSRSDSVEAIEFIQRAVKQGNLDDLNAAQKKLSALSEDLARRWHSPLPETVDREFDFARNVIREELAHRKDSLIRESPILILTNYMMITGRIDCHAPQLDVNSTVNP